LDGKFTIDEALNRPEWWADTIRKEEYGHMEHFWRRVAHEVNRPPAEVINAARIAGLSGEDVG
jgi:hypothetical protein